MYKVGINRENINAVLLTDSPYAESGMVEYENNPYV